MIPVQQTILHSEDRSGNCLQAVTASLWHLPIEGVPHFLETPEHGWWEAFQEFFETRGMRIEYCQYDPDKIPGDFFYIMNGESPRGIYHSVIYRGDEMVHDPHPDGNGLKTLDSMFLIRYNTEK